MKMKPGDVFTCGPEEGCGIKVVVIEACAEAVCDLKCCGKDMVPTHKVVDDNVWKQYCKEGDAKEDETKECCATDCGADEWKQYAQEEKK